MPTFHSLRVAAIDPLTDDAVALTFEVPEELRDEYVFTAGQHLSIRGTDEKRRSFSIFTAAVVRPVARGHQGAAGRLVQPGRAG